MLQMILENINIVITNVMIVAKIELIQYFVNGNVILNCMNNI